MELMQAWGIAGLFSIGALVVTGQHKELALATWRRVVFAALLLGPLGWAMLATLGGAFGVVGLKQAYRHRAVARPRHF